MDISIPTDHESYVAALMEIESLLDAEPGSPESERLDELAMGILTYSQILDSDLPLHAIR